MERKTAQDFDQDLLILFDAYVHGDIDRRGFLDRATKSSRVFSCVSLPKSSRALSSSPG